MRAKPSAVTRLGCTEIGRSGNASTASSCSLTKARLIAFSSMHPVAAPENSPGGTRVEPPAIDDQAAVHDDVRNAAGIAVGLLERGFIAHGLGIEQRQIGEIALTDQPALAQMELGGGLPGHFRHGSLVREQSFPHVAAEHPREGAIHAGMRAALVRT